MAIWTAAESKIGKHNFLRGHNQKHEGQWSGEILPVCVCVCVWAGLEGWNGWGFCKHVRVFEDQLVVALPSHSPPQPLNCCPYPQPSASLVDDPRNGVSFLSLTSCQGRPGEVGFLGVLWRQRDIVLAKAVKKERWISWVFQMQYSV